MNVAWRISPGWRQLTAEVFVGDLSEPDAAALVARRGLSPESAHAVLEFGHGHPLALELAADAVTRHSGLNVAAGPPGDVVEELFDILLDDLPTAHRRTVETASILRRVTMPLLSAVLDPTGQDVDSAWRTLRDLPFSSTSRAGLELDPLPRTVIAGAFELRDPASVARVRSAAARAALREAGGTRNWDTTADLLYLVQNPVIRNSYLPPTDHQHPVERAVRDDRDDILAITRRYDGAEGATAISRWWDTHPGSFVVARGGAGEVTAYGTVARLAQIDPGLAAADPVTAAVLRDVRLRPPPPESEILLSRRTLGSRRGESATPELGSIVVDLKRLYLELRPRLARVYAVVGDWPQIGPVMRLMGFGRVEGVISLGGVGFHLCALDFGPGSVDGWLARHVLVESGDPVEPDLDCAVTEHAIPLNASRPPVARLSAREREVLTALADGLTNRQLANRLFISERTANRHLSNIYTKLGVRNRTAAARIAIEAGLAG
jgi:DNA-binding CsgD family transcriptional regulator